MALRRTPGPAFGSVLAVIGLAAACGTAPSMPATAAPTAVGSALRAARSHHCPSAVPAALAGNYPGLGDRLVPLTPSRLLLCAYRSRNSGPPGAPATARAVITARAPVSRLSSALNGLGRPPGGTYDCPNDTGASVLEIFTDAPGHHEVEVLQFLTGCQSATNGHRDGWVGASDAGTVVMSLLPSAFRRTVWP